MGYSGITQRVGSELEVSGILELIKAFRVGVEDNLFGPEFLLLGQREVAVHIVIYHSRCSSGTVEVAQLVDSSSKEDAGVAKSTWSVDLELIGIGSAHAGVLPEQTLVLLALILERIRRVVVTSCVALYMCACDATHGRDGGDSS